MKTAKIEKEIEIMGESELHSWSANGKFFFFDHQQLKKLSISDGSIESIKDEDGKSLSVQKRKILEI